MGSRNHVHRHRRNDGQTFPQASEKRDCVPRYRGRIKIKGYFGDKKTIPQELLDKYLEAGIYSKIFEGDRVARMNMMLVELLFWAMAHYPQGTNVLIITKNQNILERHKVWNVIESLEERDFYFAIEHPHTFFPPTGPTCA
ncbi:hypothetical protein HID58_052118 [Brassica napus]|uniref:Uncharacterized protein n=1 Tax=Brassica napus TaxID=3708 RepID=A0ABQ8AB08_BRANA|nr:hypothetical protein HID58_052118 [Brassica napus]